MPRPSIKDQDNDCKCDAINPTIFKRLLDAYPDIVPDKLKGLDHERLVHIPTLLKKRREDGDAHLSKEEVQKLVDWKLSHGTFRPSLKKLVASNPAELIIDTTRQAFAHLSKFDNDTSSQTPPVPAKLPGPVSGALTKLTSLKGIGPATASLLMSVHSPETIPFFSDELYLWSRYDDAEEKGKGKGWGRQIGYTAKEYGLLFNKVQIIRERLRKEAGSGSALELEMVAYYLGQGGSLPHGEVPTTATDVSKTAISIDENNKKAERSRDAVSPPTARKRESETGKTSTSHNSNAEGKVKGSSRPKSEGATAGERRSKRLRSS